MGTRCDFYVGRGTKAEWIGSYPFDGYPDGIEPEILAASTEKAFRKTVRAKLIEHKGTTPDMGWPWPWDNSGTTDYAYAFDGDRVWCSRFGSVWFDPKDEPEDPPKGAEFPDMSAVKSVTLGERSGLIVLSIPK